MTATAFRSSNSQYHDRPGKVHASNLLKFLESPRVWFDTYIAKTRPREPATPAMAFGTLVHSFTLEPEKVDAEFVCVPPAIARRMSNRVLEDWSSQNANGREVVMPDPWREAQALARALRESPETRPYLEAAGEVELSLDWEEAGLQMTARLDKLFLREPVNLAADVKTTSWIGGFESSIYKWGYDLQAAQYSAAVEAWTGRQAECLFLVVDKKSRECAVVPFPLDHQCEAQAKRQWILRQIRFCFDSGYWPHKKIDWWTNITVEAVKSTDLQWTPEPLDLGSALLG